MKRRLVEVEKLEEEKGAKIARMQSEITEMRKRLALVAPPAKGPPPEPHHPPLPKQRGTVGQVKSQTAYSQT